ncbi:hypothetical protein [Cohnella yongneupensis]|uniref:DUF4878 domain-containing protein n=1 Tax=Cohnella yongneupensis TaxID=425006 RepID=A0ABW0R4P5_9BACL
MEQDKKKEAKPVENKNKPLLIGAVVIIIVLAFLVGYLLNDKGSKDTPVAATPSEDVQLSEEAAQPPSQTNESQLSPEETINAYLTAVKTEDYETAAKYVSENAKKANKGLRDHPDSWIQESNSTKPLRDFSLSKIKDTDTEEKKTAVVNLELQSLGTNNTHGYYTLELENGVWMVNPL